MTLPIVSSRDLRRGHALLCLIVCRYLLSDGGAILIVAEKAAQIAGESSLPGRRESTVLSARPYRRVDPGISGSSRSTVGWKLGAPDRLSVIKVATAGVRRGILRESIGLPLLDAASKRPSARLAYVRLFGGESRWSTWLFVALTLEDHTWSHRWGYHEAVSVLCTHAAGPDFPGSRLRLATPV
jgi:hypothetical protein